MNTVNPRNRGSFGMNAVGLFFVNRLQVYL